MPGQTIENPAPVAARIGPAAWPDAITPSMPAACAASARSTTTSTGSRSMPICARSGRPIEVSTVTASRRMSLLLAAAQASIIAGCQPWMVATSGRRTRACRVVPARRAPGSTRPRPAAPCRSCRTPRCRRGDPPTPVPARGRARPARRSGARHRAAAAARGSRCVVQRGALGVVAGLARLAVVVVELRRLKAAVGRVRQHPPTLAEPVVVLLQQRVTAVVGVGGHFHEVTQLGAELHQHAVLLPGQAAAAVLLAAASRRP
ncbi:hypothetical protein G6F62_013157 [Rhizopus arrhizus]|nr:hypothetical protein G6F62_013157 [Rhizopus arrhizus]